MVQQFEDAGLSFTGKDESGRRMEVNLCIIELLSHDRYLYYCCWFNFLFPLQIVELPNHPYFIGVQFHPEFKSRPGKPSAVFLGIPPCFKLLFIASKITHARIGTFEVAF